MINKKSKITIINSDIIKNFIIKKYAENKKYLIRNKKFYIN